MHFSDISCGFIDYRNFKSCHVPQLLNLYVVVVVVVVVVVIVIVVTVGLLE